MRQLKVQYMTAKIIKYLNWMLRTLLLVSVKWVIFKLQLSVPLDTIENKKYIPQLIFFKY